MRLTTIALLSITLVAAQTAPPSSSSDPKERVRAIRDLTKQADEGIPGIAAYAADPSVEVRLEAVKSLNAIGGPRTLNGLAQLSADSDPEIQINAVDGLINIFVPGYLKSGIARATTRSGDALKVKFNDPGDLVVDGYVNVTPEAITAATNVLAKSKSLEARANAARALGIFRARPAIPQLGEALYSKDDQLMYESLVAIQKIRDPGAGPSVAFLVRDLNEKVQTAALRASGILRTKQAAPGIRTVIDDMPNARVLRVATDALAMIADPPDRGIFLRFLTHKDAAVRAAAAEGLGRIRNPADAERLNQAFEDEREFGTRLSMAFALVALGRMEINDFSPFRYLINGLNRATFRNVSLAFLTELARESAPRLTIYPNIARATKDEKTGICQVLAESGERESVPYVNGLKDDKDPEVAQACLRSLRTLEARLK
ncbi:MAG: HEAT repeat domain-containing protein [Bryobacteraceae bacterium]